MKLTKTIMLAAFFLIPSFAYVMENTRDKNSNNISHMFDPNFDWECEFSVFHLNWIFSNTAAPQSDKISKRIFSNPNNNEFTSIQIAYEIITHRLRSPNQFNDECRIDLKNDNSFENGIFRLLDFILVCPEETYFFTIRIIDLERFNALDKNKKQTLQILSKNQKKQLKKRPNSRNFDLHDKRYNHYLNRVNTTNMLSLNFQSPKEHQRKISNKRKIKSARKRYRKQSLRRGFPRSLSTHNLQDTSLKELKRKLKKKKKGRKNK